MAYYNFNRVNPILPILVVLSCGLLLPVVLLIGFMMHARKRYTCPLCLESV